MHGCEIIAGVTTASMYAEFALRETRGVSPTYERLALAISGDAGILALLGGPRPACSRAQSTTSPAARGRPELGQASVHLTDVRGAPTCCMTSTPT